jgi:hypothetical protein
VISGVAKKLSLKKTNNNNNNKNKEEEEEEETDFIFRIRSTEENPATESCPLCDRYAQCLNHRSQQKHVLNFQYIGGHRVSLDFGAKEDPNTEIFSYFLANVVHLF